MQSRAIVFAQKQKPMPPLACVRHPQTWCGYYPARKTMWMQSGKQIAAVAGPQQVTTNIVNNLRMVNNITLRVSLFSAVGKARAMFADGRAKTVSAFALETIDTALKNEIDRELALMRRGDNIGTNQRRRNMGNRYLMEKPHQIIRYFYSARMQPVVMEAAASAAEDSFHSDIIRERQTQVTRTSYEQHNEKIIHQENGAAPVQTQSAQIIADQVFHRIERKLRLERERSGWLR